MVPDYLCVLVVSARLLGSSYKNCPQRMSLFSCPLLYRFTSNSVLILNSLTVYLPGWISCVCTCAWLRVWVSVVVGRQVKDTSKFLRVTTVGKENGCTTRISPVSLRWLVLSFPFYSPPPPSPLSYPMQCPIPDPYVHIDCAAVVLVNPHDSLQRRPLHHRAPLPNVHRQRRPCV